MINTLIPMITAIGSALVALIVVVLTHTLTSQREHRNRRHEQRIHYLISVYRAFCRANNHPRLYEVAEELEQAVADVQLFGTPTQVRLIQQFADDLGNRKQAELNDLLIELRDGLRAELKVEPLQRRHVWLRVGRKKENQDGNINEGNS